MSGRAGRSSAGRSSVWGRRRSASASVVVAVIVLLAGCTSTAARPSPSPTPSQRTRTVTQTRPPTPRPTFTPAPAGSVHPLAPGDRPPAGERDGRCPYIRAGVSEDPTSGPNVADIEGDHVYRTILLTRLAPVGCRFYFYAAPYEAVADIRPARFATAAEAHDALVRTAGAGHELQPRPHFVPGVDGIAYRTAFFGVDGTSDWAFAFAKGRVLVVVRIQQNDTSYSAVELGRAVVGRF